MGSDSGDFITAGYFDRPRWNGTFQEYRYKIVGEDTDGNRLAVVFSIDERFPELVMITCGRW